MRWVLVAVNAEQLLYRSPGGIGRYTAQLLTLLPTYCGDVDVVPVTALHRPDVVRRTLEDWGVAPSVRSRVAIQALPRPLLYDAWLSSGHPRLRGVGTPDLVHAPSVAVPPKAGMPLVVTVADAASELFPEAFPSRGRRFHRRGMAAAARRADVVITGTEAAADEIVSHSSIRAESIRVVPYGIAPLPAQPARSSDLLAARGLSRRQYVLWVGSLEPRKGVGTLVAAMADLRKRGAHPDVQTVLAGYDGWLGQDLIGAEELESLGPSLHQLGRVSEEELWALYAGATVFAFPSLHEGFGLPVVEAMSQAVPVVASDIAALREVAGAAAILVPPGDRHAWAEALDGLLSDEAARLHLAGAGEERSRLFGVEQLAAATRAVYLEVGS